MKKIHLMTALLLALLMVFGTFSGVLAEEAPAAAIEVDTTDTTMCLYLGGSPYSIIVPNGYYDVGVTEDESIDGMVSTFISDADPLAFDLYFCPKDTSGASLAEFIMNDCEAYNGTDLKLDTEINGINVVSYRSIDPYDGDDYFAVSYAYEYKDWYVLLDFYSLKEEDLAGAETIMNTLSRIEGYQIPLGLSPYGLTIPTDFYPNELTEEDLALGMVGYYCSDNTELDFDIYQVGNDEMLSLADAAAYYMALDGGFDLKTDITINNIPVAEYYAYEFWLGEKEYITRNVLLEDAMDGFIHLVFWLDNAACEMQCEGIIRNLDYYDYSLDTPTEDQLVQLGSTDYAVTLPGGYISGSILHEEFLEEGLIATYYSPLSALSFEVYQCDKVTEGFDSLDAFVKDDCETFNGKNLMLGYELPNGIVLDYYEAVETYDDVTYYSMNYAFEADGNFVQLCFYSPDVSSEIVSEISSITMSLSKAEQKDLAIGETGYSVKIPASFVGEEIDIEVEGMKLTAYASGIASMNFNVYELTNAEKHLPLKEYAAAEAASYLLSEEEVVFETINGIDLAWYYFQPVESEPAAIMTYIIENGETGYVEFDFVVRNYIDGLQGQAVMQTLNKAA